MNKLKKITSIALAVLLVFASIPTINVSAAKIKLNKTKITIYVGKTVTLKVQNNKKKVTRSSVKLSFMYFCTHHRLVKADIGNFNISSV